MRLNGGSGSSFYSQTMARVWGSGGKIRREERISRAGIRLVEAREVVECSSAINARRGEHGGEGTRRGAVVTWPRRAGQRLPPGRRFLHLRGVPAGSLRRGATAREAANGEGAIDGLAGGEVGERVREEEGGVDPSL